MGTTMMDLLHDGVPITLLLDLADPDRLPSRAIYRREQTGLQRLLFGDDRSAHAVVPAQA